MCAPGCVVDCQTTCVPSATRTARSGELSWNDRSLEFVLRIGGSNTVQLGINRCTERDAIVAASQVGIAPEVMLFTLPEGHLVTRFVQGRE